MKNSERRAVGQAQRFLSGFNSSSSFSSPVPQNLQVAVSGRPPHLSHASPGRVRGCAGLSARLWEIRTEVSLDFHGRAGAIPEYRAGGLPDTSEQKVDTNPQAASGISYIAVPGWALRGSFAAWLSQLRETDNLVGYSSEIGAVATTHAATRNKLTEESNQRIIAATNAQNPGFFW